MSEQAIKSDENKDQTSYQFLTFTIGPEHYGVEILKVQEIRGWSNPTTLPNSPEYMRGVINLRGKVIPIFDLKASFGNGRTEATEKNVVIVLDFAGKTIGVLVDSVSDIYNSKKEEIKDSPTNGDKENNYVKGMISNENDMIILLDLNSLFNQQVLSEIEQLTDNEG